MRITPKISVVVCTYNRGQKIRECLNSLINQSLPKNQYEIVVVNDGSTDGTAEILQTYKDIKMVTNNPNKGLGQSRNIGALASTAEIIAFTDDDCIADPDWLKNLLTPYVDPEVKAVGGKIAPFRTDAWLLKFYEANNPLAHVTFPFDSASSVLYALTQYVKRSFSLKQLPEKEISLYMIVGANMSMRRSVFDQVGGFDGSIKFGGEEEDFWMRLRIIDPNAKLLYAPSAVIGHDYDSRFKDAIRRNYKYGLGASKNYLKDRSRLPVIYPFPFAIIGSLGWFFINPYFVVMSVALVFILYSGWIKAAITKRRPLYVCFAFVQFFLEAVNGFGFLKGVYSNTLGGLR